MLPTHSTKITMSSREIAELTGKKHFHVKRDIERMGVELEIDASIFGCTYLDGQNREQIEYLLDRRITDCLLTGYSAKLRIAVLDRWRELEEQAVQPALPSYPEALRQLASSLEAQAALEHKIEQDAPKVEFTERVQASEGSASMSAVAKTFKTGPIRLYAKLREMKIIKPGTTEPYQRYIDQGWFELEVIIIDKGYRREAKHVTRVTNKGQFAIQQLIDGQELLH